MSLAAWLKEEDEEEVEGVIFPIIEYDGLDRSAAAAQPSARTAQLRAEPALDTRTPQDGRLGETPKTGDNGAGH